MQIFTFIIVIITAVIMAISDPDNMPGIQAKIIGWAFILSTIIHGYLILS